MSCFSLKELCRGRGLLGKASAAAVGACLAVGGSSSALAGGPIDVHTGCNGADVAPPGFVLDIDDVLLYLDAFANQDPIADLHDPAGVFDIDDILAFLDDFANGCPDLTCVQLPSGSSAPFSETYALVDLPGPAVGAYEFQGNVQQLLTGNGEIFWDNFQMQGLPIDDPRLPPMQVQGLGRGGGLYDPQTGVMFGGQIDVMVSIDGETPFQSVLMTDGPVDFSCDGPGGLEFGVGATMTTPFGNAFFTGICGDDPDVVRPNATARRWCVYVVGFASPNCPNNFAGSTICVACPANGRCPNRLTFQIQGTECWFQVKRQGGAGCKACPGNVPANRRYSIVP